MGIKEAINLYESPCWDPNRKCTWFVNVYEGRLLKLINGEVKDVFKFNFIVTSVNLCSSGKLILTSKDQILLFNPEDSYLQSVYKFNFGNEHFRLNDCKVSPTGKLIFSYFEDIKPRRMTGSVGIFSLLDSATMLYRNQFLTPNGIVVDGERNIFWISDTSKSVIYQIDLTANCNKKLVLGEEVLRKITIDPICGRPDGGNLDIHGNYWVALHGGSGVGVWSPDGDILNEIILTQSQPTMVCFSGNELNRIDITYKVIDDSNEKNVGISSLFVKISGVPAFYFKDI